MLGNLLLPIKHQILHLCAGQGRTHALNELEQIEDAVDDEPRALYPRSVCDIQDYMLTVQHEYPERVEQYDDASPFLKEAATVIEDMRKEAEATVALATAAAPARCCRMSGFGLLLVFLVAPLLLNAPHPSPTRTPGGARRWRIGLGTVNPSPSRVELQAESWLMGMMG